MIYVTHKTDLWKMSSKEDVGTDVDIDNLIEEINQLEKEIPHRVVLFNDDHHIFEDVVHLLSFATGKDILESFEITLEAHNHGRAICYAGDMESCRRVCFVLMNGGLVVEID